MKNIGASVQAKLKNLSKQVDLDMPSLLRRYVQERLLYRMSISPEAENFVLKGGLLMAVYNNGDLMRPTEDIDFSGISDDGSVERLRQALITILSIEVPDDGVEFVMDTMTIKKDRTGIIPGGKIAMMARVGSANVDLKIDVGFGNPVTPEVNLVEFPTILDGISPRPTMNGYPLETVIAEKLHAMVQFGAANTRLKDYYDIWMMSKLQEFNGDLISDAIETTFKFQEREIPEIVQGLTDVFIEENTRNWNGFLKKLPGKPTYDFAEVVTDIGEFINPLIENARTNTRTGNIWMQSEGWLQPSPTP